MDRRRVFIGTCSGLEEAIQAGNVELRLERLADERIEGCAVQGAHMPIHNFPALEYQQRGNGLNAVTDGEALSRIGVDLGDLQATRVVIGGLVQQRSDGLARTAPWSPEINEHRGVGTQHILFEVRLSTLNDLVVGHECLAEWCGGRSGVNETKGSAFANPFSERDAGSGRPDRHRGQTHPKTPGPGEERWAG
jgi:hypothetical protein